MSEDMNRRRFLAGLAAGAASLLVRGDQAPDEETRRHQEKSQIDQRKENESTKEYGKRICIDKGEGIYRFGEYQVDCHFSGGYSVTREEYKEGERNPTYTYDRFDYPKESDRKLDIDTVSDYIENKNIVLLGEGHHEDMLDEENRLEELFPIFKEHGFTHVCLEIDRRSQSLIDEYMSTHNAAVLQELSLENSDREEVIHILNLCVKYEFDVVCIDNIFVTDKIQDSFGTRDADMQNKIEQDVLDKNGKAIVYVGAAHAHGNNKTSFAYKGDESLGPGITLLHEIKPLYRRLVDTYGDDTIGSINLNGFSEDIPYFYD